MLKKEELQAITTAIREAENHTSGEIQVYVAKRCKGDPLETASRKFHQLNMDKTRLRNGVLILVAPADHKAAIYGDTGIIDKTSTPVFWDEALEEMLACFKRGEIREGLCKAVAKVGELIKSRYPVADDDINELGDEVILEE